jgi:hypothetical protein
MFFFPKSVDLLAHHYSFSIDCLFASYNMWIRNLCLWEKSEFEFTTLYMVCNVYEAGKAVKECKYKM